MTKISLRVYNREIEAMIESGQVDEAIAHCQNILKTYPMHLETYRLLGKAFLETRRYGDAADIFQRVLMSVPEDFVSHVGMSIIRDDENKLDDAIWHMERAFEVQPSNPAIQDELRKLYGRRDGVQPPKVRLTRDALANMYAQGALYSQAIAEIKAVLADDPNRPDLQVMLARAYSKDGRKKQAIEICTELLKKYPYCFDALRILIDLIPAADQNEFTQTYRSRVNALDPYANFVTGSIFNSEYVPDNSVSLELLNYDPNDIEKGSQPAWASSLGIKIEAEKGQQNLPDWLSEKTSAGQPISDDETSTQELKQEREVSPEIDDVPEWMRSSGWGKAMDQKEEQSVSDENELTRDGLLAKAEIPDWLKEMAPDEEILEPDGLPEGFEAMLDGKSLDFPLQDKTIERELEPENFETSLEKNINQEKLPDWMEDGEMSESNQTESESNEFSSGSEIYQNENNPLSMEGSHGQNQEVANQHTLEDSSFLREDELDAFDGNNDLHKTIEDEDNLPDWLKDIGEIEPDGDLESADPPMDEIQYQTSYASSEENNIELDQEIMPKDDLPEWLKDIGQEKQVENVDISSRSFDQIHDNSAEFSSSDDEIKSDQGANSEDDLPEWLKDIGSGKPDVDLENAINQPSKLNNQVESFPPIGDQIDSDKKFISENELPDWLKEIDSPQEMMSPSDDPARISENEDEIPSLRDEGKIPPEFKSIREPDELESREEISNEDTKPPEVEPELDGLLSQDEQDSAIAWLENLAAKQGAKPEELLTNPEERMEELPDWVKNSIEDDLETVDNKEEISLTAEHELVDTGKLNAIESSIEDESKGLEFPSEEDQLQEFETDEEVLIEENESVSPDQKEFPEYASKDEPEYSHDFDLHDFDSHDGVALNPEITEGVESEIDSSAESDVSKWLSNLDVDDAKKTDESISPKVSEFYGEEKTEPIPDWLKEMEKEAKSSEWIPESEVFPEKTGDRFESGVMSDEKDIDDIGEIFPTDTEGWNLEVSESDPRIEPLRDDIRPVTSGEWQPLQGDPETASEEKSNISKAGSHSEDNEFSHIGKSRITGLLSRIPAIEIEKEAGTLERAQSFIENGEIKKALENYSRLVKKGQLLESVIHDLRETTYRYPVEIEIWQLLGDAYMRADRLQDALDAYTKAEELLR